MKRCPECRRDYYDDALLYCLEDGNALVQGSVPPPDEPATAILHSTAAPGEAPTRAQINTTDQTAILPADTGQISKPAFDKRLLAAPLLLIAIVLAGYGIFRFIRTDTNPVATFEKIKNVKMTKSGKVITSALSPDGKYFAHVTSTDGQQTLFVRQTSANNDITVVPAAKLEYWGITFSRDSEQLFYSVRDANGIAVLYRIPALGGESKKIIEGVDCPITFSPDGKQFAFVRGDFPGKGKSSLLIANSDGTGEKSLATRNDPEHFYPIYFTGPSWSPDGKMIAAAVGGFGRDLNSKVIGFSVTDGKETEISKQEWGAISRVEWQTDGRGLMTIAIGLGSAFRQLWHLSYPDGRVRQVINEFKDYRSLSMTADSSKLVTVQTDRMMGVWVAPASDLNQARQITPTSSEGLFAFWTPDGKIIYFSDVIGGGNIGIMDADGTGQRELTTNPGNINPAISWDGSRIVYESGAVGSSYSTPGSTTIWTMNRDGSDPREISAARFAWDPIFSVDGKSVIYASSTSGSAGLMKVPVEDGEPVRIADGKYSNPRISPDGKFIAAIYLEKATNINQLPNKIAILPIEGGVPLKTFDIQFTGTVNVYVVWSADSKNIIYNQVKDNIGNLWSQPIGGGPAKPISDFKEGLIFAFDLSRDGSQFVISRGPYSRDAVLISNEQ
ncbi:MAG: hypothetical protein ABL959_08120 [Pyrinomonadaceae bacterium]